VGYGKRALAEIAMFRYQVLIGPTLRARTLVAQKTEARLACSVINRRTSSAGPSRSGSGKEAQQALGLSQTGLMHQRQCCVDLVSPVDIELLRI
jgi:hypothetical protein